MYVCITGRTIVKHFMQISLFVNALFGIEQKDMPARSPLGSYISILVYAQFGI